MNRSLRYYTFLLLLLMSLNAAARFNYVGKHFFYSFPMLVNFDTAYAYMVEPGGYTLTFASKHRATIRVHFNNTRYGQLPDHVFTVTPGSAISYALTAFEILAVTYSSPDVLPSDKSLEITSDSNIAVHAIFKAPALDDGTELLPVDNQPRGTRYRVLSYTNRWETMLFPPGAQVAIIATCDNVTLRITPANDLTIVDTGRFVYTPVAHPANIPYNITLNKGETYLMKSDGPIDIAGTEIEVLNSPVNMPICVYYANIVSVPDDMHREPCCKDFMLEQMLPIAWWDTLMPVSMMYYQRRIRIRVLSDANNNYIFFDNTYVKTLNNGQYLDTVIDRPLVVHTSKPAAVGEFMMGIDNFAGPNNTNYDANGNYLYRANDLVGDPDMLWVMSPSQGIRESYFKIFGPLYFPIIGGDAQANMNGSYKVALTIISRATNVPNIRYDDTSVAMHFRPFPGDTMWQYAHIPIDTLDTIATHHLVSPERIMAHVCKIYIWGGYSFNLSDMATDTVVIYKCAGLDTVLIAPYDFDAYQWSTGDTTRNLRVAKGGNYHLIGYKRTGCDTGSAFYYYKVIDTMQQQRRYMDTLVCFTNSLLLQLDTGWSYEWDNGSTASSRVVTTNGIYTVHYWGPSCIYHTDTFNVTFYNKVPVIGNNLRDCKRTRDEVWAMGAPGDTTTYTYIWLDSAMQVLRTVADNNGDTFYAPNPGRYNITVQVPGGCSITLPFVVTPHVYAAFTCPPSVCAGQSVTFTPEFTENIASWYWNFGDGTTATTQNPNHIYTTPGTYRVMLVVSDTIPCTDTAYATIRVDEPPYVSFIANRDSLCVGSLITLLPSYIGRIDNLVWSIGSDSMVHNGAWTHSFDKSGTYVVVLTGKSSNCDDVHYADTLQVWPFPIVALRDDTTLCPNQSPVLLMNLAAEVPGTYKYLWSTGATSERISITMPGDYWLSVISEHGCITTDTVLIKKSCYIAIPNAFTPNGDGVNDYFFPRDLLSPGVSVFHMRVYNRWGAIIFETNNTEGKGWDGKYNDVAQLQGVYIYLIDVIYTNGIQEQYKGNVTLIR